MKYKTGVDGVTTLTNEEQQVVLISILWFLMQDFFGFGLYQGHCILTTGLALENLANYYFFLKLFSSVLVISAKA